jgi:arylsulfatase A-like enzyme
VTTLDTPLDNRLWTFPQAMRAAGYRTGLVGKWHLGHGPAHDPVGFDEWRVLPGQGHYHDPVMLGPDGAVIERGGYVTDLITDDCIDFIDRDDGRPFLLLCHHKATHRTWETDVAHAGMYEGVTIPEPDTFRDDLTGRADVVRAARMRMLDLDPFRDLGAPVPAGLSLDEEVAWRYQRFIARYLRVVAALDDNVGRLLDHLDACGIAEDTVVIYTSDQGFFLGDHGWFDKRLMYEASLAMPLLIRAPGHTTPGAVNDDIVVNVDLPPTILELAGVEVPAHVQGRSFLPLLDGATPPDWPQSMYYRYWMHRDGAHACPAHYGVRTRTHKLICYYNDPLGQPGAHGPVDPVEWELFDLVADPLEVVNIVDDPAAADVLDALRAELGRLQAVVGDTPAV